MKIFPVIICFLIMGMHGLAQNKDTVSISGVTIQAARIETHSGYKHSSIDTIAIKQMGYQSINDLLSRHSPVFIKSYGQGNMATASFRGTSASHTKVLWNGIELNNPMLGQSDFSQIPVSLIDNVAIRYGGAGISKSSGSLGGSVTLNNSPKWEDKFHAAITQYAGSFDTYYTAADLKAGNNTFLSRTRFLYGVSENDYKYLDNFTDRVNPPLKERQHSAFNSTAVLQEIYLRDKKKNVFTARVWGQQHYREIAPPLGVSQTINQASQSDEAIRFMASWGRQSGNTSLHATSGYIYDFLHYKNPLSEINSKNYSGRFQQSAGFKTKPNDAFAFEGEVKYTRTDVNSNNYQSNKQRQNLTAFAGVEYMPIARLSARVSLRQNIVDSRLLPVIPSLGLDYQLLQDKKMFLKANISRNYRLPSLNDLYWYPGGNPDLLPEKGITMESGISLEQQLLATLRLNAEITGYRNEVTNWIAWMPDSLMNYWTPDNVNEVVSQGLESALKLHLRQGEWNMMLHLSYVFTEATVEKTASGNAITGKQLVYVPKHNLQSSLRVTYHRSTMDVVTRYTGKRYTASDNTAFMPSFQTTDLAIGQKIEAGRVEGRVMLKVNNLFNENYQVVAWYPMPRRNYLLSLKIQLDEL